MILLHPFYGLADKKKIALRHLTEHYGDGNWQIIQSEPARYDYCDGFVRRKGRDGVRLTVTSDYLEGKSFHIQVNKYNLVTKDCFLPTKLSLAYGLPYKVATAPAEQDDFNALLHHIDWITWCHYPYGDAKQDASLESKGSEFVKAYSFYKRNVSLSPKRGVWPDLIPREGRVYELKEVVDWLEKYYCHNRRRGTQMEEQAIYDFVFAEDTDWNKAHELMFKLRKEQEKL